VSYLRVVPLGGLGEIGMNCMALESPDGILVVDCGITFPREKFGVDIIHPLFEYLEDRADDLLGVVITHGHEDHIGALPYLLRKVPRPVWAPPYALSLIRERLKEFRDVPELELHATTPRRRFNVGRFNVEPLRVTHSIPDATALAIETPAGVVVHTGDFKLEDGPLDGEGYDRERFEQLGHAGVALLLSDSTNVDVPGSSGREAEVAAALRTLIASKRERVVIGIFPSNIYRLKTLGEVARATGRRICLIGRSVQTHARAATELGRLGFNGDLMVSADRAREVPRSELLVIAAGTQAEPQSALTRLAWGDHPRLKLNSGDAVILSSRTIPGNDRAVWDLVCQFERRGIDVHVGATDPGIHVSGHACREEQSRMIEWIQPRAFVPVHGTYHHLMQHAKLARRLGVGNVELVENGQTVLLDRHGLVPGATVRVGRVHIDAGAEVPPEVLRERASMAEAGAVFLTVPVTHDWRLDGPVALQVRGVVATPEAIEKMRDAVERAVREHPSTEPKPTAESVKDVARRAARRVLPGPVVVIAVEER
jgi:ribonuclease J